MLIMYQMEIFQYTGAGLLLGTIAGVSPGPLLALVISQSLRFGKKEGVKIAFTPLITDLPAILGAVFLMNELSDNQSIFGYISLAGGAYVIFLGLESMLSAGKEIKLEASKSHSLKKGVITNFLNPHPYLFWISVGTPLMVKAFEHSLFASVMFVFSFYITIIGSKVVIAIVADKSRNFLKGRIYQWILRVLGMLLIVLALILIKDGVNYLS